MQKYKRKNFLLRYQKRYFTIIEVTVAMLVLAILLTLTMQFVGTAQTGWSSASGKSTIFENARVVLGLINRQIQGIYYKNEVVPFFHKGSEDNGQYSNDSISFIAYLNDAPNEECTSSACEVQYQLYYNPDDGDIDDSAGWFLLSVTGNKSDDGSSNDKWNFYNYRENNLNIFDSGRGTESIISVFTDDNNSRDSYMKLIPYVTDLSFKCYNENGEELVTTDLAKQQVLPSSIEITLSLLDKISWEKWISLGAKGNKSDDTSIEPVKAKTFREKKQHTFKRTIYIGNRL